MDAELDTFPSVHQHLFLYLLHVSRTLPLLLLLNINLARGIASSKSTRVVVFIKIVILPLMQDLYFDPIATAVGVYFKSIDRHEELVMVKGTMDGKALAQKLKEKMKWCIDIIPEKKDDGDNKKGKEGNAGGSGRGGDGGKKEASSGGVGLQSYSN